MTGAYTAKPDAAVADPDVPDGWDFNWPPPPGAYPPGYTPELSLVASGAATVTPGSASGEITFKLVDHVDYVTAEPTEPVTYTAEFASDGTSVDLKFSGDDSFGSSIYHSYSDAGDSFWGGLGDFEFDIDISDVGETIILTATSSPLGFDVTQTHEIVVAVYFGAVLTVIHTPHPTGDNPGPTYTSCKWQVRFGQGGGDSAEERGSVWVSASGSSRTHYKTEYGNFDVTTKSPDDESFVIECTGSIDGTYTIKLGSSYVANTTMTIDMTLLIGAAIYTKTTEWPLNPLGVWDYETWLTIDGLTGEVTVINP